MKGRVTLTVTDEVVCDSLIGFGDRVRKVISDHPYRVRAALAGNTLFWVNSSAEAVEVSIHRFKSASVRITTKTNLRGERVSVATCWRSAMKRSRRPHRALGTAPREVPHRWAGSISLRTQPSDATLLPVLEKLFSTPS